MCNGHDFGLIRRAKEHTHALFALKVQRKVSDVLDWPPSDHLWIGRNHGNYSHLRMQFADEFLGWFVYQKS
jgi:hypothetical protein